MKEPTWQERFDKEFIESPIYDAPIWKGDLKTGQRTTRREVIKTFIQQEISLAKAQVIRDILNKCDTVYLEPGHEPMFDVVSVDVIKDYVKENGMERNISVWDISKQ